MPTMGALHEGHLSLIHAARQECAEVGVSIFVNPLQFGPREDFGKYPRQEQHDLKLCEEAGADWVFMPQPDFAGNLQTTVSVSGLRDRWEGSRRPGHFDGVATIVARLFGATQPDVAVFGLKDYQQCRVIAALVEDLTMPIKLRFSETVREQDGLAMSSRNAYLSASDRQKAPLLYKVLLDIGYQSKLRPLSELIDSNTRLLEQEGFMVDYLVVVDERTLEPLNEIQPGARTIVAAKLGETWLIDNLDASLVP